MTRVGCELHSRKQQVAVLDPRTGEVVEQELVHDGDAVERFDRALPPPVTIGIETTGYTQWVHALMPQLGHPVLVGEAAKIRALVVRKTTTDRRDARHRLALLQHDRFPTGWIPDPGTRDRRALIAHRVRLVRMRTMVKNGLQTIAVWLGLPLPLQARAHDVLPLIPGPHEARSSPSAGWHARLTVKRSIGNAKPAWRMAARTGS